MLDSSQSPGTLIAGDPMVSSDLGRHLHMCDIHSDEIIPIDMNTNKIFFKDPIAEDTNSGCRIEKSS